MERRELDALFDIRQLSAVSLFINLILRGLRLLTNAENQS